MEFRRGDKVRISEDSPKCNNLIGEIKLVYNFSSLHREPVYAVQVTDLNSPMRLGGNTFYFEKKYLMLIKRFYHYII